MAAPREYYSEDEIRFLKNVGETFRFIREQEGLSQKKAAEKAGTRQARISAIENGQTNLQVLTLLQWARAYGYDIELTLVPLEDKCES